LQSDLVFSISLVFICFAIQYSIINCQYSIVLPFNFTPLNSCNDERSGFNRGDNLQSFWSSIVLSSIKHQVLSYARSARTLYIKITKGYILQHGMVLFLIVRSDQEINKTLSALSVFAVQHFPDLL